MSRGGLKLRRSNLKYKYPNGQYFADDEVLHLCIRDDGAPKLRQLLDASPAPDINHSNHEFGPALHFAAWCGDLDAVDILLAAGADASIAECTMDGLTAIAAAAHQGHRDIVKRLWACFSPVEHLQGCQICLVVAASNGHASIVEDLLDLWNGWPLEVKILALRMASSEWQFGVVNLLLKRESFEQSVLQKALHCAADLKPLGHFEAHYEGADYADQQLLIATLIDAGADPNCYVSGTTPLILTVVHNSILTCALKTLLEKGADPNRTDGFGRSALRELTTPVSLDQIGFGLHFVNETAIQFLLQYKASVSLLDSAGECPLHWAAFAFDLRLFRIYLDSQPDQDALLRLTNNNGETLLHYAAAGCHIEVIEYLLSRGLDVNAVNSNDWTPLMCALTPIEHHYGGLTNMKELSEAIRSARLLLSHGANPNIVTEESWTPLHVLTLYLDPNCEAMEFAKDLISRGVSPEARAPLLSPAPGSYYACWSMPWGYRLRDMMADPATGELVIRHERTPLHWAAERGAIGVMKALLSNGVDVPSTDADENSPVRMAAESMFVGSTPGIVDDITNLLVDASNLANCQ
ncbi:hypothetical protein V494_01107 [Pseudogymnoascus sp. VKM F-4513 (FW-928)]|nr:hypothetical protein V494_01107 [Pseudogymnoascus sp. VKM F-4513 (FW-928)]